MKEKNSGHNVGSDPNVTQYAKQGNAGQDKTGGNAIKQNKTKQNKTKQVERRAITTYAADNGLTVGAHSQ
jgi:hypothetical protein